jgi:hypothetical protein
MMLGDLMAIQEFLTQQKINVKFFFVIVMLILSSMELNQRFVKIFIVARQVEVDFFSLALR